MVRAEEGVEGVSRAWQLSVKKGASKQTRSDDQEDASLLVLPLGTTSRDMISSKYRRTYA